MSELESAPAGSEQEGRLDEDWVSVDERETVEKRQEQEAKEEERKGQLPPLALPEGWSKVTDDGMVIRKRLEEGSGVPPPPLTRVYAVMEGRVFSEGSESPAAPFFSSGKDEHDFILGQAQVAKGVEMALCSMLPGERCLVRMSSDAGYGYGDTRRPKGLPEDAILEFDITLVRHEKEKNLHQMTTSEKLAFARQRRELGKSLFAQGKFGSALRQYEKGLTALHAEIGQGQGAGVWDAEEEAAEAEAEAGAQAAVEKGQGGKEGGDETDKQEEKQENKREGREQLVTTFLLNSAVCCNKLGDYSQTIAFAGRVLERDPGNSKARFLRAVAYRQRQEFHEAERDYKRLLEGDIDAELRSTVQKHLSLLERSRREQTAAQARTFRNAFQRTGGLYADMPDAEAPPTPVAAFLTSIANCFRRLCGGANKGQREKKD